MHALDGGSIRPLNSHLFGLDIAVSDVALKYTRLLSVPFERPCHRTLDLDVFFR